MAGDRRLENVIERDLGGENGSARHPAKSVAAVAKAA